MSGDYTRLSFDPGRSFRDVIKQQGRVKLDADSDETTSQRRWWLRRISVAAPEWTDFNESDPGVTLIELVTFLTESLLWLLDEQERRRRRRRRLGFLVAGTAGIGLVLWRWGRTEAAGRDCRS